jgi:hypothetical protein
MHAEFGQKCHHHLTKITYFMTESAAFGKMLSESDTSQRHHQAHFIVTFLLVITEREPVL